MEALAARLPVCFEIVTTVPDWFFAESLSAPYTLHPIVCDIGLVQRNALEEDPGKTLALLDCFYPLDQQLLDEAAFLFADCRLLLCDIAPLGIAAAREAGIVSVLLENFTWDWIYQAYLGQWPGFSPHINYLRQLYEMADYHLQTEPVCEYRACDLLLAPIARQRRMSSSIIREQLQSAATDDVVLVTMGGVPGVEIDLSRMADMEQCFILPGRTREGMVVRGNLRLLSPDSGFYHPDLVAACDVVIGKVGYSTLAEVYQAGVPFGYICRPGFRESAALAAFINREMVSMEISWQGFSENRWLDKIPELASCPRDRAEQQNGASAAADFLCNILNHRM